MKNLQSNFEANEQSRPVYKERITQVIDSFFHATDQHTGANFSEYLNCHGIDPIFRENKDGRVYGITFIDNRKGAVINGSELGKKYSGQALVKRFNHWTAGEREKDERPEWFQPKHHPHVNSMPAIRKEFLGLVKAEKYYPEPTNPLPKKKKKKRVGRSL